MFLYCRARFDWLHVRLICRTCWAPMVRLGSEKCFITEVDLYINISDNPKVKHTDNTLTWACVRTTVRPLAAHEDVIKQHKLHGPLPGSMLCTNWHAETAFESVPSVVQIITLTLNGHFYPIQLLMSLNSPLSWIFTDIRRSWRWH